jgi:hypothetical protein
MRASTDKHAATIKKIVDENYEPGNQARCKLAIYRTKIFPIYGISERTFWRYIQQANTLS